MTTINNAYTNALLADATYVNDLDPTVPFDPALSKRMTPTLAKYIADNFTIVTQLETPEFTGSGFDATVWRQKADGKLFVSMRGTEFGADLVLTNTDLALLANARFQLRDMVNWWLRETAPLGVPVNQIDISISLDITKPFGDPKIIWVSAADSVGTGRISAADLAAGIEVNGHSLGGYLATAFTRLFGAQAHVTHTSTFNSAGFAPGNEKVFQSLEIAVGPGYGLGRFPGPAEQSNYFAQHGINVTTNSLWFSQQGRRVEVFNEESVLTYENHSMYKLTDALAMSALLEKLDPSLTFARANALLEAGSSQKQASMEGVFNGLNRIIKGPSTTPLLGVDAGNSDPERVKYHEALAKLAADGQFKALIGKVNLKPSDTSLASLARSDFGALISLVSLSPVAVTANSAAGSIEAELGGAGWSTQLTRWKADRALSVEAKAAGEATYTDRWMSDRAAMLNAVVRYNNKNSVGGLVDAPGVKTAQTTYEDLASKTTLKEGSGSLPKRFVKFGDTAGNTLLGETMNDALYGGAGGDVLKGQSGSDYMEGGEGADDLDGGFENDTLVGGLDADTLSGGGGADLLQGGEGVDLYKFSLTEGFGRDNIVDFDGKGKIEVVGLANINLNGSNAKKVAGQDGTWRSSDGQVTYTQVQLDSASASAKTGLLITFLDKPNDSIMVEGWSSTNNLGISFDPAPEPAKPGPQFVGDFAKALSPTNPKYYDFGPTGFSSAGAKPGESDKMSYQTGENVKLEGLGGNDALAGGSGDDFIDGGDNHDYLSGGLGADTLIGGSGDDYIFGSARGWLNSGPLAVGYSEDVSSSIPADAFNFVGGFGWGRYSLPGNGLGLRGFNSIYEYQWVTNLANDKGNFIDAGAGDDLVEAGTGNDTVRSGSGDDTIYGLGQDDVIFGGNGKDRLYGDGTTVPVEATTGMFYIGYAPPSKHGNDVMDGGDDDDTMIGGGRNDQLFGGSGNDILQGDTGSSASTLLAGAEHGNDVLDGGSGNDTYLWGLGDGSDQIVENERGGSFNTLKLLGSLIPADLRFSQSGNDLLVIGKSTADQIVVKDHFLYSRLGLLGIERVVFAGGATRTRAELVQRHHPRDRGWCDSPFFVTVHDLPICGGRVGMTTLNSAAKTAANQAHYFTQRLAA